MADVTLRDLQRDTGEPLRHLHYWSDAGLFRPVRYTNRRGRGVQRLFAADPPLYGERTWALIASRLNRLFVPIGIIRDVIDRMRILWSVSADEPAIGWERALQANPIAAALRGEQVLVLIGLRGDEPPSIHRLGVERPAESPTKETLAGDSLTTSPDEEWAMWNSRHVTLSDHFLAESEAGFLINLTTTLQPLRIAQQSAFAQPR